MLVLSLPPCVPACSYLCLPDLSHIFRASFLAFITSCTLSFHHQVSLSHGDLRPAVMLNTSCSTLKIVVLLCSRHSCTLSTGLIFSNTVSLNFILGFSSFNLHQFILGIACSDFQRFLPYLLLLMCQFSSPPTITLSVTIKCRTQLLIHMLPKRFVFILYTTHLWSTSTHDVNHHLF